MVSNIVIGIAVVAFVLYRQLQPRAVREERPYALMAVLAVLGAAETVQFAKDHHVEAAAWVVLVAGLLVGAGFGLARGMTVHVWRKDGVLTRQGNAITVVLWVVAIAVHLGLDQVIGAMDSSAKGLADTSLLLYLGIALTTQRYATLRRAERLDGRPVTAY